MIELLKRFYRPFRLECILGPLSKLIEVVFDLTTPLVVMRIIDRGVGGRSVETVLAYGGLLVLMAFNSIGLAAAHLRLTAAVQRRLFPPWIA